MDTDASEPWHDSLGYALTRTKLWKSAVRLLARQSQLNLMLEAVALVIVIGIVDYITGYEVTFFPFYSIPILLVVWFKGAQSAVFIAMLSAFAWWAADTASGHHYSREWLQIWDTIVRFMFFLLVIFSGAAVRERIKLLEHSQKLEDEIINISEREQQRIGRDLHDGLGQYLVGIGMAAESLKNDLTEESPRGSGGVGRIADLLHDAVSRVRGISRGLSPVDRDEGGLKAALKDLASTVSKLSGIPCTFVYEGDLPIRNNTAAVHLYRIAQEALGNAIKHAKATLLVIAFTIEDGLISLRVSDNGIGVHSTTPKGHGMGFSIMSYRARMLGGTLEVLPNTPTGTIVVCEVAAEPEKTPDSGQ